MFFSVTVNEAQGLILLHHRTCCTEMRRTQPTSQLIAKFCCYCYVIIYVELTLLCYNGRG